jgi:hypothetical protein
VRQCAQPTGAVCDSRPDHPQAPSAQCEGGGAVVPATSARPGRRTGCGAQCQTPGPLPVLRASDELPLSVAVLSARPAALAQVAQSTDAREDAYHGATSCTCWKSIRCFVRASVMPGQGWGVLHEEPSASIAHARVCEGRGRRGYGAPKRARSRKRRTRPREAYGRDRSSPTRSRIGQLARASQVRTRWHRDRDGLTRCPCSEVWLTASVSAKSGIERQPAPDVALPAADFPRRS